MTAPEANAIFTSGDAAFTVADSLWWGTFKRSGQVEGRGQDRGGPVSRLGPNRTKNFAWDDIWGWAIPKSISRPSARSSPRRCWPP